MLRGPLRQLAVWECYRPWDHAVAGRKAANHFTITRFFSKRAGRNSRHTMPFHKLKAKIKKNKKGKQRVECDLEGRLSRAIQYSSYERKHTDVRKKKNARDCPDQDLKNCVILTVRRSSGNVVHARTYTLKHTNQSSHMGQRFASAKLGS